MKTLTTALRKPFPISVAMALSLGATLPTLSAYGNDKAAPSAKSGKSDMLLPEEVPLTTPNAAPNNQNGFYLGANIGFGQGRTTESSSSPGTAFFTRFEPGYQVGLSSWHRIEMSGELLTGSTSFRNSSAAFDGKYTLDVNYGFLAKIGYGYSLGTRLYGIAKVGAGALVGTLATEANGESVKSDVTTGNALFLGWSMIVPVSESIDLTGGISTTYAQFDVGSLKAGQATYRYGKSVIVNNPTIDLGFRFRI